MSSPIPERIVELAKEQLPVRPGSRGMVYNGDNVQLIKFLEMGTKKVSSSNLR
jgi:hypothetical protein